MDDLFDFNVPEKRFTVMGNPISHSKSPNIHSQFGQQTNIQLQYTATQVDPGGFPSAVLNFQANGGSGINVTVPFKVEAYELADQLSERAQYAGAVNTLRFEADGQIYGDNTDGIGLVRDIQNNLNCPIKNTRVLMIGAGGAVRGALLPILEESPTEIVVANRTVDKAMALARHFTTFGNITGCALHSVQGSFDIIINGSAASLGGTVPDIPPSAVCGARLVYDMMYSDQGTVFMKWATDAGAKRSVDGLGMLVEQAAESFRIWNEIHPQTQHVMRTLRPHE